MNPMLPFLRFLLVFMFSIIKILSLFRCPSPHSLSFYLKTPANFQIHLGETILPPDAVEAQEEEVVDLEEEMDEQDNGKPPLGIRIRIWHREEDEFKDKRGAFLGQVKLGYDVSVLICCQLIKRLIRLQESLFQYCSLSFPSHLFVAIYFYLLKNFQFFIISSFSIISVLFISTFLPLFSFIFSFVFLPLFFVCNRYFY